MKTSDSSDRTQKENKTKIMAEEEHMVVENSENNEEKPKRKVQKTILDNFSKLVHSQENVRVKSAVNLLKYLQENRNDNNEIKYALKRLIRGLGSSSSIPRVGYYSSLAALLNFNTSITISDILEIVKTELHKSGRNSDGENADICAGQILTAGAVLRSNLWENSSSDDQKKIIELLTNASKERTYLGLLGYTFIIVLLEKLNEKDIQNTLLPLIQPEVSKPWGEQSLDSLFLLLSLKNKCPSIITSKFVKKSLGTSEIFCKENYEHLANILMNIPKVTAIKHPVYNEIVESTDSKKLVLLVQELDKHLRTPNRNRLLVFLKFLTNVYTHFSNNIDEVKLTCIPEFLTPNFIRQLLAYFRTCKGNKKDPEYQETVYKLFDTLLILLKSEKVMSDSKISVIKKFLFTPGTFIFEKVTKSKIIQQITFSLDTEGVKKLSLVYRGVVQGTEKIDSEDSQNETWLNNDRLYGAHLLIKLLNNQSMKSANDWKVEQLVFLMHLALFKDSRGISIGRDLAESLRSAFFGALDLKLSKLEDLQFILSKLIHNLNLKLTPENYELTLRNPLSPDHFQTWQKTMHTLTKIEKKGIKKQNSLRRVFFTLFLHMGLQLFNDPKLASDSLNELFACYQRTRKNRKNSDSSDISIDIEDNSTETELHWIEVVTDLFLNLLSHNSHLLRNIIKCVFPHLCHYMTSTTIHQILSVLDPKSDDNPLSSNKNDDSDEGSSDKEEESDGHDPEEEESDAQDSEEEENSDDDDINDETVTDKLRMALQQALSNTSGANSDNESVDLDQMSDSEAEKLDKALADAFRQFKPNHGKLRKQSKDQETLTHFRVRVLDLIDIYLDSVPSMILTLEIMLPLLQALEFSIKDEHQKPLTDRLKSCLRKLLLLKKFSDVEGVGDVVLNDLLKSLLEKGTKNAVIMQDMGEQIANCCFFVVKCSEIIRTLDDTPKSVSKSLKKSTPEIVSMELVNFLTKRDCLTPYVLFKNLLQMNWDGNLKLATVLLSYVFNDGVKQFKKNQACELLKIFYSNQRYLSQKPSKFADKLSDNHKQFSESVLGFFKDLCGNPDKNVTEKTVCSIFNILTAMKTCPLKIDEATISWGSIAELIREYRSFKTFSNDAKIAFNKLCRALGVSNIVKMKNTTNKPTSVKLNGNLDKEIIVESKKKKKRKSKDALLSRKEAKKLRLQSLSEGLSNGLDFTSAENVKEVLQDRDESIENGGIEEDGEHSILKKRGKKRKEKANKDGENNDEIMGKESLGDEINGVVKKKKKKSKDVKT